MDTGRDQSTCGNVERVKMGRMSNVQDLVEGVLTSYLPARDDDDLLYLKVVEKVNPMACNMALDVVLRNRMTFGIPNFESVRRARQKLQASKKELRGSARVTDARYDRWKEMREYALEDL